MTSVSKKMYKLHSIVSKCNNTYHSTIKVTPVDVKSSTNLDPSMSNLVNGRVILKFNNSALL